MRLRPTLLALSWAVLFALPAVAQTRIIDGDTLDIDGTRYRLFGIDAPERAQRCLRDGLAWQCGTAATDALIALIAGRPIDCRAIELDRYGRNVAVCGVAGMDLGERMVRDGWALSYRSFSTVYVDEEDFARVTKAGIWTSGFVSPEDWRRGLR